MPTDVTVEAGSFNAALKKYIAALDADAHSALYQTAQQVLNKVKRLAPVDTGRLRSSYVMVKEANSALIGSSVGYATFVEYGTIHQHGKPHFRPAVESANTIWATIAGGLGR